MFEKIKGKEQVNLTLDKDLISKLKTLKNKMKVPTLSPFINEILWDWIDKQINPNLEDTKVIMERG